MNGSRAAATAPTAGRIRVYQASADKLLGSLPDRSIDLVITDPPYVSVNRSSSANGHLQDWFADGLTWPQIGRVFAVARAKLKADGVLMAMTNNDGLREAIGALEQAGFSGIRIITWDRQYPGLGGGLRHQCEFVLVGRLPGSRTLAGVDLVSVAAVGPGTADRYPTAKPDGLGRELATMAGIGPGSLVVDPFCGSGAMLVGAAERGASVVAGDVAARAVQQARVKLGPLGLARGRAKPSKPNGTRSAKPSGLGRTAKATKPAVSKKPSGSSQPPTATRLAKSAGAYGAASGHPTGTRPARAGKPTGRGRPPTVTRPAQSGKPKGSGRSPTAARPASGSARRLVRPRSRP